MLEKIARPDEIRRWMAHEVAYWITGPWQVGALRDMADDMRETIAELADTSAPVQS